MPQADQDHSTFHSRRALLAGGAAVSVAVTVPLAASVMAAPHPDAELLAAWDGYVRAHRDFERAYDALPGGGKEKDHEPYYRVIDFHHKRVEGLPAHTAVGVAVKLRYLLTGLMECRASFDAAVYGEPVSAALAASFAEDYRYAMMWRLIQDVERVARNGSEAWA